MNLALKISGLTGYLNYAPSLVALDIPTDRTMKELKMASSFVIFVAHYR